MRVSVCIVILAVCYGAGEAARFPGFFIPEEWQTILSVFYSHLPPTRIGSDKRFGVGFRLGRNADAQILVELGPQSDTQPLADTGSGFSKRESGKTSGSRRQKTAGRFVNNTKKNKTADAKTRAIEVENKKVPVQEKTRKSADQQLNVAATETIEEENKTESTTIKNKKRRKRPQKKAKLVDELTEDRSGITNNEITTNSNSEKRPEMFLNNFMNWLNRFNQQRNVT